MELTKKIALKWYVAQGCCINTEISFKDPKLQWTYDKPVAGRFYNMDDTIPNYEFIIMCSDVKTLQVLKSFNT